MKLLPITAALLAMSGCATVPVDADPPVRQVADTCKADPGKQFIGQRASAETGAAILTATGSTRIRWVPPRTAVTMEYALGRVTVGYDDGYIITAVSCS